MCVCFGAVLLLRRIRSVGDQQQLQQQSSCRAACSPPFTMAVKLKPSTVRFWLSQSHGPRTGRYYCNLIVAPVSNKRNGNRIATTHWHRTECNYEKGCAPRPKSKANGCRIVLSAPTGQRVKGPERVQRGTLLVLDRKCQVSVAEQIVIQEKPYASRQTRVGQFRWWGCIGFGWWCTGGAGGCDNKRVAGEIV